MDQASLQHACRFTRLGEYNSGVFASFGNDHTGFDRDTVRTCMLRWINPPSSQRERLDLVAIQNTCGQGNEPPGHMPLI